MIRPAIWLIFSLPQARNPSSSFRVQIRAAAFVKLRTKLRQGFLPAQSGITLEPGASSPVAKDRQIPFRRSLPKAEPRNGVSIKDGDGQ